MNFTKICPVGAILFHAAREKTDKYEKGNSPQMYCNVPYM